MNLKVLRNQLTHLKIDGFLLPAGDEYFNEDVPETMKRLKWLSGFSGSAGAALVMQDKAILFVPEMYRAQAVQQSPEFEICSTAKKTPLQWIEEYLKGQRLGIDGWLHSTDFVEKLRKLTQVVMISPNPVDQVWEDRPNTAPSRIQRHDIQYAGIEAEEKIKTIQESLQKHFVDACVLSAPDSICWLLNVRGREVHNTPLILSRAIMHADGRLDWFLEPQQHDPKVLKSLPPSVTVHLRDDFIPALKRLRGKRIGLDSAFTPALITDILENSGARIQKMEDPVSLPKACKNPIEIQGTKSAHARDAQAMGEFLKWIKSQWSKGHLTELLAAEKLYEFRKKQDLFVGESFTTISAVGANAALPHYKPTIQSNRPLESGKVYLVDSGGQYLDGTTDITRTLYLGDNPPQEIRENYTRVLKGLIALTQLQFPEGTTGTQIDVIARQYLWDAGLDYAHGTGHGVGSFLGVHEGPARISPKGGEVPLKPGMILSNEPGFYKDGEYGIRLENLMLVVPAQTSGWLTFDTLTFVPFEDSLIVDDMLSPRKREWLEDYQTRD